MKAAVTAIASGSANAARPSGSKSRPPQLHSCVANPV
jgi:hypothetical protein